MIPLMIPQTDLSLHSSSWQQQLKTSIRDVKTLAYALKLTETDLHRVLPDPEKFPLNVPLPYLSRIESGNINDPLLRQILPINQELTNTTGYSNNPVGDNETNLMPGLIHKYHGRVLLVVSPHCAINCRYCFRREFDYKENRPNPSQWDAALNYIAADNTITEVIYSGGDPLTLVDKKLAQLTQKIAQIPHVKRLRIHTRLPVVIPQRVTQEMLNWLTDTRLLPLMVLHINHPNEIDDHVTRAVQKLRSAGISVLNQSVLLKGVNDCTETLIHLSEQLFNAGILPYYLHLLDKVSGASHFDVSEQQARLLLEELRSCLSGYLVPKLVKEIAGLAFKQPVL